MCIQQMIFAECTIIIHGGLLSGLLLIRDAHAWILYHQSILHMSYEWFDPYRISHYKLKNIFKSDFCNSKGIFDNSVIKLFEDLKFKREYFSYSSPMNMVYDSWEKDINVVKDMLCRIYQVLALHSSIAKKEFPFLQ